MPRDIPVSNGSLAVAFDYAPRTARISTRPCRC
jgi:hypothetical protein